MLLEFQKYKKKSKNKDVDAMPSRTEETSLPGDAIAKYGKDCVEQREYDEQENEQFEVVENARPAEAHMRNSRLRWKGDPPPDPIFDNDHEAERIALSLKVLGIMKDHNLLDGYLTEEENDILKEYFTSKTSEKPSANVIGVIDKSIGHALRVMRHHPERFDGAVTDDMKRFISSGGHAKPVLLEVMMIFCEYIPDSWGGRDYEKTVTEKVAETKSQMEAKAKEADKNENVKKDEKKDEKIAVKSDEKKNDKNDDEKAKMEEKENTRVTACDKARKTKADVAKKEDQKRQDRGETPKTVPDQKKSQARQPRSERQGAAKGRDRSEHRKSAKPNDENSGIITWIVSGFRSLLTRKNLKQKPVEGE